MAETYRLPTAPQTIGHVLDAGTKLFMASFSRVVALALLAQLAMFVPQIFTHFSGLPASSTSGSWLRVGLVVAAYIVAGGLYAGLYLAAVLRSWRIANGDDMPAGNAVRSGYRRTPRAILAGLFYGMVVVGGFVLLVIPGIYLMGALALFVAPLLFENVGARASLSRSLQLMRGNWWRGVTVLSVPLILATVVLIVVQLLPLFVFSIDISSGDFEPTPLMELLSSAAGMFLNGLLTPWSIGVTIALYNDLRLRREGDDLSQRLAGLSAPA